jgi:Ser/Thr protein kinase RdoA (MazF antagonist)
MLSMLGRRGGFDGDDLEGWQRRAALLRGARMSNDLATAAYGSAGTLAELHVSDFLAAMPPDLRAAFDALDAFNATPHNESHPIPQDAVDAVTAAAATISERLKPAIEALKPNK